MGSPKSTGGDRAIQSVTPFECTVTLAGWRLHIAHMAVSEGRDLGNVMDVATRGALSEVLRCHPNGRLEENKTIVTMRESMRRLGVDTSATPPSSERLISSVLEKREVPRGSLPWEFMAILTAKSCAPWTVLSRDSFSPPLEFRLANEEERLPTQHRAFDGHRIPVLADRDRVIASPWTDDSPDALENCSEPVFICYVPSDLFRTVDPKSHLGRVVWLTWAYRFVFEKTYPPRQRTG